MNHLLLSDTAMSSESPISTICDAASTRPVAYVSQCFLAAHRCALAKHYCVDVCDVDSAVLVVPRSGPNAQDAETADLTASTKKLERQPSPRGMHRHMTL